MSHKALCEMRLSNELSSMASQARFGLRYFSGSERMGEMPELVNYGIRLCSILLKGAKARQKREVSSKDINYITLISPLEKSEDLGEVKRDANRVSNTLHLILEDKRPPESEVTFADSFLINIGNIYQRFASSILNDLEVGRC